MPPISVIIVNYNTAEYLCMCLDSILSYMPNTTEIIVVDNASTDDSCQMVKDTFPQVKLIESKQNVGFGLGNNLGVTSASNPYVMLFNSDAILKMDTGSALVSYMESHPNVTCVTPRVVLPQTFSIQAKTFGFTPTFGRVLMQSLGLNRLFPNCNSCRGIDGDTRWAREMPVGWVSGVCMMMRKADYLNVGGFDERFFMYCEDVELCLKLGQLGDIVLLDDYEIIHFGGASSKSMTAKVRNSVLQQRHLLMILRDYDGGISAILSSIVIGIGMLGRLLVACCKIPQYGIAQNESLCSAWARLKDLIAFSWMKLPKKSTISQGAPI